MAAPTNILDLRRMLADRFPGAQTGFRQSRAGFLPTGIPALDHLLGGGLPKGEVTELVGDGPGSGSAQALHALLAQTAADGRFLALVDGADSFDIDAPTPASLERLLLVRCRSAEEALKAADLLLRDRNFPLVALDLKLNPPAQLRRVQASVWHRLGRIAEHNGTTLLVVTPFPMVGAVTVRVEARSGLRMKTLEATPSEVIAGLQFTWLRGMEAVGLEPARKQGAGAA
jgi:hypothetical protein